SPWAPMEAGRVIQILDDLGGADCRAWVHGGWGVDALLGEETRRHDDLDLVVVVEDWPILQDILMARGYAAVEGGMPTNTVLLDGVGHQIDLHPIAFEAAGDAVYRTERGEE